MLMGREFALCGLGLPSGGLSRRGYGAGHRGVFRPRFDTEGAEDTEGTETCFRIRGSPVILGGIVIRRAPWPVRAGFLFRR